MDEKILMNRRLIEFAIAYAEDRRSEVYDKWSDALEDVNRKRQTGYPFEEQARERALNAELQVFKKLITHGEKWLATYDEEKELTGFAFDDVAPLVCEALGYTFVRMHKGSWVHVKDQNGLELQLTRSTVERWIVDYRHKVNLLEPASDEVDV